MPYEAECEEFQASKFEKDHFLNSETGTCFIYQHLQDPPISEHMHQKCIMKLRMTVLEDALRIKWNRRTESKTEVSQGIL